jgi:excinuclease UvrABC nuclease subunit
MSQAAIPPEVADHALIRQLTQAVDELTELMKRCAEKRKFEEAAHLRDQKDSITRSLQLIVGVLLHNPDLQSSRG